VLLELPREEGHIVITQPLGDLAHRQVALGQQTPGVADAPVDDELLRRHATDLLEQVGEVMAGVSFAGPGRAAAGRDAAVRTRRERHRIRHSSFAGDKSAEGFEWPVKPG